MITRPDVAAQLENNVRVNVLKGMNAYTPRRTPFVQETSSDGAFELYADMGSVPWPGNNPSGGQTGSQGVDSRSGAEVLGGLLDGGNITLYGGNERSLLMYNNDWPVGIAISHNAINDNRVGNLDTWARTLGTRYEQHKDYLCFDALNQGALTTSIYGVGYDGVAMFSASHVDKNADYQTAQSNTNSLALSVANFTTVHVAGTKFNDDRGQPGGFDHRLIIAATNLEYELEQVTRNREVAGTANRDRNPYEGTTRGMTAPGSYLDDSTWYVVDDSLPQRPIILQMRQEPNLEVVDWYMGAVPTRYFLWFARYAVGYGDWRLIIKGN